MTRGCTPLKRPEKRTIFNHTRPESPEFAEQTARNKNKPGFCCFFIVTQLLLNRNQAGCIRRNYPQRNSFRQTIEELSYLVFSIFRHAGSIYCRYSVNSYKLPLLFRKNTTFLHSKTHKHITNPPCLISVTTIKKHPQCEFFKAVPVIF